MVIAELWHSDMSSVYLADLETGESDLACSVAAGQNLVGSVVSEAQKLIDVDGRLGVFFVFQDLSVRVEGTFRLRFSLIDLQE